MDTVQIDSTTVPRQAKTTGREDPFCDGTIYEQIREDILSGVLPAGSRLKAAELAKRYGTSTNPIREALQQLRGEGFVLITPNRGARVRPIDEDFLRNIYEITALLEPYMARWFVEYATNRDVAELESLQEQIEQLGFDDPEAFCRIDLQFHRVFYDNHYNRDALEMWHRRREILRAIGNDVPFSRSRRKSILTEHRALIECVKTHDGDGAAEIVKQHVTGSGRHVMEYLRSVRAANERDVVSA